MPFEFERLAIPEVVLIETHEAGDGRGFFREIYKRSAFAAAGIGDVFVQENQSSSPRGVLRGLHYQRPPHAQSKLVRVIAGRIFDVVVDLRPDSPTMGRWIGTELSADDRKMIYVPSWCAHGFCVLSERADVVYTRRASTHPNTRPGSRGTIPRWPSSGP